MQNKRFCITSKSIDLRFMSHWIWTVKIIFWQKLSVSISHKLIYTIRCTSYCDLQIFRQHTHKETSQAFKLAEQNFSVQHSISIYILFMWLGHRDPENCQRTRSLMHTSDRSESNFKFLVHLTNCHFSLDHIFVSKILITLRKVHIPSIFISLHQRHVKLNIFVVLLCKNVQESILCVLWINYWWDIRAIYWQYFEILKVNCN